MTKAVSIKEAWRNVYQERTCPPYAVLISPEQAGNVAEHRRGCPFCAMKKENPKNYEAWAELGAQMALDWPAPEKPAVQPGQVWSLIPSKGGWDERFRHVNPPMVLIMDVFEDVSGVRVAQLFDERALIADGDVDLGPRYGVAEVWNTYALDCADLNLCFGQISPELLNPLKEAVVSEHDPVDEDSVLWHFRQLELEVGAFMAMEAMGRLVERHERNAVRHEFSDIPSVRSKVLAFDSRIRLPEAEDGLAMLAEAEMPIELILQAAAGEGEQTPFTVVTVGGSTNPCRGVLADLLEADHQDSVIVIRVRIPDEYSQGLLFAWWRRPDTGLEEGVVESDPSTGIFSARFSGKSELDFEIGEPILLLVRYDDAQD